jgi:hypothetical protein
MADALEVDLQVLLAGADEEDLAAAEETRPDSGGEPPQPHLGSPRYLHQAYLKVILNREVGSAYSVLDERAFESHIRTLPVDKVVEDLSKRRRELEFVKEELASEADLHPQVRLFLEELVREHPAEDIRVLAVRRAWEPSERGTRGSHRPCESFSEALVPTWGGVIGGRAKIPHSRRSYRPLHAVLRA